MTQICSWMVRLYKQGILPAILSNKYSIVFNDTKDMLPILKSLDNPLVIHDSGVGSEMISVTLYNTRTWTQ